MFTFFDSHTMYSILFFLEHKSGQFSKGVAKQGWNHGIDLIPNKCLIQYIKKVLWKPGKISLPF